MNYKYLFGPVPSRRLGLSLGIDLIPFKTCTYDCIYCESGRTTNLTIDRKEYVPIKDVCKELDDFLEKRPELDYLTFSGSGEPTLHSGIGKVLKYIKKKFPEYKTALITNACFFDDPSLRKELYLFDVILPSLDAVSEFVFRKLNRSHKKIDNNSIIKGLIDFRKEYSGEIWLEIFIIEGINDVSIEVEKFKKAVKSIHPDKLQLNTLDRPGAEKGVKAATLEAVNDFSEKIEYPVEVIADFYSGKNTRKNYDDIEDTILKMLKRRPMTLADISSSLGIEISSTEDVLMKITSKGKILREKLDRGIFYSVNNNI